jgi:hypothetical protein
VDHTLAMSASLVRPFIMPLVDCIRLASVVDARNLTKQGENGLLDPLTVSVSPLKSIVVGLTQDSPLCATKGLMSTGLALQFHVSPFLCGFELIVGCSLNIV